VIRQYSFSATQNVQHFDIVCELKLQVHNRDRSIALLEAFKNSFSDSNY